MSDVHSQQNAPPCPLMQRYELREKSNPALLLCDCPTVRARLPHKKGVTYSCCDHGARVCIIRASGAYELYSRATTPSRDKRQGTPNTIPWELITQKLRNWFVQSKQVAHSATNEKSKQCADGCV